MPITAGSRDKGRQADRRLNEWEYAFFILTQVMSHLKGRPAVVDAA